MATSLLGPTTTPSASSDLAAHDRPHLLHLQHHQPGLPRPPLQQHPHQLPLKALQHQQLPPSPLLDSPSPSPPLPDSLVHHLQPRPAATAAAHTSPTSHPQPHPQAPLYQQPHPHSISPQRRPLPPSPSSSPPPPAAVPRDDSLYTFSPDHTRSSSSVASSVTAVEPPSFRSSCPITRHYNGPAVLAAIVSLAEPALLRSRPSSGSLSRAPRRLPPSSALAEAADFNKMHQTSSRLLRMTSDDRPFTRVSRPAASYLPGVLGPEVSGGKLS